MNVMNAMHCNKGRLVVMGGLIVLGIFAGAARGAPITASDLEYSLETDKDVYLLGETVNITHRMTNPFQEDVELNLYSTPGHILWVTSLPQEPIMHYWAIAHGGIQPPEPCTILVEAGQTTEWNYSWSQTDSQGVQILHGDYRIQHLFYGDGSATTKTISIIPEPASMLLLLAGGCVLLRRMRIGA